jgi:hypothetical protein
VYRRVVLAAYEPTAFAHLEEMNVYAQVPYRRGTWDLL